MRIATFRDTEINCSLALLALLPLAVMFGTVLELAIAFISLSVHELAHAMIATRLGYGVISVDIQPFGFVARLKGAVLSPSDRAAIYAAGPVSSLLLAAAAALWGRFIKHEVFDGVIGYNILIAAINLIPALPLDGGRIVQGLLRDRGEKLLLTVGSATGVMLVMISILLFFNGVVNPTYAAMGGFLFFEAIRERKRVGLRKTMSHSATTKRINSIYPVEVNSIAVSQNASLSETLRMLPHGGYSVIVVIDEQMHRICTIDEMRLREIAAVLGSTARLGDAVKQISG